MACSWAIAPVCAQDISQIAKSDPLITASRVPTTPTSTAPPGWDICRRQSNSFFANLNFKYLRVLDAVLDLLRTTT